MRKSLKPIIKILLAVIGIVFVIIISPLVLLMIIIELFGDNRPTPTDADMIKHFESNNTSFEALCSMIIKDDVFYFPLFETDKRDGIVLPISIERESMYDSLLKKLQIKNFSYFSPHDPRYHMSTPIWIREERIREQKNNIKFYYFVKGDATWGLEKGFEYVVDRMKEKKDKKFTEMELRDAVFEKKNKNLPDVMYYKKINDHWNLFMFYDG